MTARRVREGGRVDRENAIAQENMVIRNGRKVSHTPCRVDTGLHNVNEMSDKKQLKVARKGRKDSETSFENISQPEKPRTRAVTRSLESDAGGFVIRSRGVETTETTSTGAVSVDDNSWKELVSASKDASFSPQKAVADVCQTISKRVLRSTTVMTANGVRCRVLKEVDANVPCSANVREKETNRSGKREGRSAVAIVRQTRATTKDRIEATSSPPETKKTKVAKSGGAKALKARKQIRRTRKEMDSKLRKRAPTKKPPSRAGKRREERESQSDEPISDSGGDQESENSVRTTDSHDGDDWTREQDIALQDSFSKTKAAPDFWKLIAKRVPGKSAQACFNRFYAGHPTPPPTASRVRSKEMDSPLSLSASFMAKSGGRKRRLLHAHRMVRRILRKQQVDDENYEADAFAALEHPDVVQSVVERAEDGQASAPSPPAAVPPCKATERNAVPKILKKRAESPDKENMWPLAMRSRNSVCSPEILKKVKDPAQLDKYIDQLHSRFDRRPKAQSNTSKKGTSLSRHSKGAISGGDTTTDVMQRAKQELRNVILTSEPVGKVHVDKNPSDTDGEGGNGTEAEFDDDF